MAALQYLAKHFLRQIALAVPSGPCCHLALCRSGLPSPLAISPPVLNQTTNKAVGVGHAIPFPPRHRWGLR